MGGQRIIGQAVTFGAQMQHGLACFEEHFDVPTLAVDSENLFLRQAGICTDEGDPILLLIPIPNTNDFCRKRGPVLNEDVDVNGQQIFGMSAAFLTASKDLLDVLLLAFELIVHLG